MSAIGATPAVLAFSLARSRWRMYSGARPRKSRANTRTAQAMTALSMPTLGPGGDFNGTPSRMNPEPSRPSVPRAYTRVAASKDSGLEPTGPNDCFFAGSFAIIPRPGARAGVQIPSPCSAAPVIGSNIWGRNTARCLDVGVGLTKQWSGARDLNPGPHGPEVWAVASTEAVFEGFALDSCRFGCRWSCLEPLRGPGLLHELPQESPISNEGGLGRSSPSHTSRSGSMRRRIGRFL